MGNNRVYTESVVTLNKEQAEARIEELKSKAAELRAEMKKIAQVQGLDSNEFKKVQKQLIQVKNAQTDVNAQTKKFNEILNNINGSSLNELQMVANKLVQQVRRLKPGTEEFVASSKKLKEVRARMTELHSHAKNTQSMFANFFTKIGWAGLVAGAIGVFRRLGSDMVNQTQLIGDRWQNETAGWKSAYNTFVADLASGTGWKQLIANMRESYKVGKEVSAILDELFERRNSLSIEEAEANRQIEEQKKIMNDVTRTDRERLDAAEKIDSLTAGIAKQKKDIAQQELDANTLLLRDRTKMTDEEMKSFIEDYNNNRTIITQATEYTAELNRRQKTVRELSSAMVMMASHNMDTSATQEALRAANVELRNFLDNADAGVVRWAGILAKYNLANDDITKKWVDSNIAVTAAETEYLQKTQRSNRTAANLRKTMAGEAAKAREDAYKKEIESVERHQKELQLKEKEAYLAGRLSAVEYQSRLKAIQEQGLRDKIAVSEKYKKETIDYNTQLLDLSIKQKEDIQKILDQIEKKALSVSADLLKQAADDMKDISEELDDSLSTEAEHISDLMEQAAEVFKELHPAETVRIEIQQAFSQLEEMHELGLLSEEDYQKAKAEIVKKYSDEVIEQTTKVCREGMENASKLLSGAVSMVSALEEAHMTSLDSQMQQELAAAGSNADERAAIEEKYQQKKLEVQKKYADIDMAVKIAQTIAAGALASIQAIAQLGPVAGAAMAGVITATTAFQVASIIAQRNAIKNQTAAGSGTDQPARGERVATGFFGGGYTDQSDTDFQPAGIVHTNEWVAPAAMVRANPITFARLESVRRSGNYRSGVGGFADGGMTSQADREIISFSDTKSALELVASVMQKLLDSMPFHAYVLASEANKENELQQKIKKTAGKKS